MARRSAGISSLQRHLDTAENWHTLGASLAEQQTASLSSQLATFQQALSRFSSQHRQQILSSPSFRTHFSQLCNELGVDPLGGGAKGLWDKIGVGDWYYALGVQVVDVCLAKRERGGGLVALDEVLHGVERLRSAGGKAAPGSTSQVTEQDIYRAIDALEPLGCGYAIITIGGGAGAGGGGKKLVRCSPGGLDRDSLVVVEAASQTGRGAVSREELLEYTAGAGGGASWELDRVDRALEKALMDDGTVWLDEHIVGEHGAFHRDYYAPGLFVME
ncbi:vacuolar-sorting protein SNF8 [Rhodotorula sp. JG-1b]|nr:vacuolar-sorting protein SNF8 [Rhodotorula sp. JG-1b]